VSRGRFRRWVRRQEKRCGVDHNQVERAYEPPRARPIMIAQLVTVSVRGVAPGHRIGQTMIIHMIQCQMMGSSGEEPEKGEHKRNTCRSATD